MGCHIWFSVPYKTDKDEIAEIAQSYLNETEYLSESNKEMYQYAIDCRLIDPVCELAINALHCSRHDEWVIYKDAIEYNIEKYNEEHRTSIHRYDSDAIYKAGIETYSDEPRIGGYPENIIRSYEEMMEFMSTGFDSDDGDVHYDFYYEEDRFDFIQKNIKKFFDTHPNGIITFG